MAATVSSGSLHQSSARRVVIAKEHGLSLFQVAELFQTPL
jgi:hypothetical protein